jgi:hypothetical protein
LCCVLHNCGLQYGKTYDCSFVRRDIPGKTFVCLNIMSVLACLMALAHM